TELSHRAERVTRNDERTTRRQESPKARARSRQPSTETRSCWVQAKPAATRACAGTARNQQTGVRRTRGYSLALATTAPPSVSAVVRREQLPNRRSLAPWAE